MLVTTKSGSNQLHGSLFEFFRNTDLDARSFFASSTEQFNLNQFGGSLGGPIQKDKTFFFADYRRQDGSGTASRLSAWFRPQAMRSGDFSADAFGDPLDPDFDQQPYMRSLTLATRYGPTLPVRRRGNLPSGRRPTAARRRASTATRFRKA